MSVTSVFSYENQLSSSKESFPQSATYCFLWQMAVMFLVLEVIRYLLTSSSSSPHHYLFLCLSFNNLFQMAVYTEMSPFQLAFLHFIVYRMFLSSLTLCSTAFLQIGLTDLHPSSTPSFGTYQAFLIYLPKCLVFSTTPSCAQNVALHQFLP